MKTRRRRNAALTTAYNSKVCINYNCKEYYIQKSINKTPLLATIRLQKEDKGDCQRIGTSACRIFKPGNMI
jgi:hypothetical protein